MDVKFVDTYGGNNFPENQSFTINASRDASGTNYAVIRGIMECTTKLPLFETVRDRVSKSCLGTRYGKNREQKLTVAQR